jgi:hypothetical protein
LDLFLRRIEAEGDIIQITDIQKSYITFRKNNISCYWSPKEYLKVEIGDNYPTNQVLRCSSEYKRILINKGLPVQRVSLCDSHCYVQINSTIYKVTIEDLKSSLNLEGYIVRNLYKKFNKTYYWRC